MIVAADYPFLDVLWTMVIFFVWVLWFWLLFTVFADIFRRQDISGWGKAGWLIFAIILPYLGVFVYLISQSSGMTERNLARAQEQRHSSTSYMRAAARGGAASRDRPGQGAARQRRDHAGRVRRAEAEGPGYVAEGRVTAGAAAPLRNALIGAVLDARSTRHEPPRRPDHPHRVMSGHPPPRCTRRRGERGRFDDDTPDGSRGRRPRRRGPAAAHRGQARSATSARRAHRAAAHHGGARLRR